MEREIEFRAWIKDDYFDEESDYYMTYDLSFEDYAPINELLSNEEYLMQYIGIKDKDDKKIYECDIVVDNAGRKWTIKYSDKNCAFAFYSLRNHTCSQLYEKFQEIQRPLEILGNIFENPELLEKQ